MFFERWLHVVRLRLRSLFRSRTLDRELEDELEFHLSLRIDAEIARGHSAEEARRIALMSLEGLEARKEELRDARGVRLLSDLKQDLRFAWRSMRRTPAFAAVAIVTLALGIGATTAIFTIANGVLFTPAPFPHPERLFVVSASPRAWGFDNRVMGLIEEHFLNLEKDNHLFSHVAALSPGGVNLTGHGEPVRLQAARVTPGFFRAVGIAPELGRAFAADDLAASESVVIVSSHVWRTYLGGGPDVIGRTIRLDGIERRIVGVMPDGFGFPDASDVWSPFVVTVDPHNASILTVIGRLKPGATPEQARAEVLARAPTLPPDAGVAHGGWEVTVEPLKELLIHRSLGNFRQSVLLLAGAVGFVLLIACANVAGLFVARAATRENEMSVRLALGAGQWRIARQLVTEGGLVAFLGACAGVPLSIAAVRALILLAPDGEIPRVDAIHTDARALTFALAAAALTGLVFGLAPLVRSSRSRAAFVPGSRTTTSRHQRIRAAFVVVEVALSLVLLVGAGLLLTSLVRARAVDPGFRTDNLLTITFDLPFSTYRTAADLRSFDDRFLAHLSAIPGVSSAAAIDWLPLGGNLTSGDFTLEDGRALPKAYEVDKPCVSPGYFQTMGIPLRKGRDFSDGDRNGTPGVAIISESVARDIWPNQDPIGRRLSMSDHPTSADWLTVVGIVGDVRQNRLTNDPDGAIYQPYAQTNQASAFLMHMNFVIRSPAAGAALVPAIRTALHGVDPDLPVPRTMTMSELVALNMVDSRFLAWLVGIFATLGLSLAVVGLYGLLAYSVTQRTREIGIRMALGAKGGDVIRLVMRQTLLLVGTGMAIGVACSLGVTRVLQDLLFGVKATDPSTFAIVVLIVLGAAALAAAIPARRATSVDPTIALRTE